MRTRSRQYGHYSGGTITWPWFTENISGDTSTSEICTDELSPGPPYTKVNYLQLTRAEVHPPRWSGKYKAFGTTDVTASNVPIGLKQPGGVPLATPTNWIALETAAIASVNPSNGIVDLGELVGESYRLPLAVWEVRKLGFAYLNRYKNPGSNYLAFKFGWLPLISDLNKLLHRAELMRSKYERLKKAKEANRIEGTLSHSTRNWGFYVDDAVSSFLVRVHYHALEEFDAWFTGRYDVPDQLPDPESLKSKFGSLGFDQPSVTAWNLLPWSWLADYFFNIGTYVRAYAGGMEYRLSNVALMAQTRVTCTYNKNSLRWPVHNSGSAERVVKARRSVQNPTPRIFFAPLLNGGELSNLSALAIARSKLR